MGNSIYKAIRERYVTMFLSGVSEIIIQSIGRWESNVFLEYIREQVDNFTYGVSYGMLYHEDFHHLDFNIGKKEFVDHLIEPTAERNCCPNQKRLSIHFSKQVIESQHIVERGMKEYIIGNSGLEQDLSEGFLLGLESYLIIDFQRYFIIYL